MSHAPQGGIDALAAASEAGAMMPSPRPIRVVSAAALFDGHDAAINIMRRLLQSLGAEVIHLGHDRSVEEIAVAAVQEDADAVAVSSYQGGHNEFFAYLLERLADLGGGDIRVYGGGGGTILPAEVASLQALGVARVFTPEDGRALGLTGMLQLIVDECLAARSARPRTLTQALAGASARELATSITWVEAECANSDAVVREAARAQLSSLALRPHTPVLGFTGPGGAGKSSVVDETVRRIRLERPDARLALLLVDPSRRRSGGALLGDRIRLNAIHAPNVFVRSLATRRANVALSDSIAEVLRVLQAAAFDLIIVETAGTGQSDSEVVDVVDVPVYVMTPEYGAPTQLEKIDMLDLAKLIVLNKSDRQGGADALRDVRKQWTRNSQKFGARAEDIPVFATIASQWCDRGMDRFYEALREQVKSVGSELFQRASNVIEGDVRSDVLIPGHRVRYLAEIAESVRSYHAQTKVLAARAMTAASLLIAAEEMEDEQPDLARMLELRHVALRSQLDPTLLEQLHAWPQTRMRYRRDEQTYSVRGKPLAVVNHTQSLSNLKIPKVAVPDGDEWGALTRYLRSENLPGQFPFTAGVFPFKREGEDPARMFAGEGGPERTNRRFHLLAAGTGTARLSTAFDSVTLYGRDPERRLDVYGKVGTSGVSVCTLDDAKKLYSGFDLCDPKTSVSMTINGPAPTILAFFLNAAIDQQVEKHLRQSGQLDAIRERFASVLRSYEGTLPVGHNGLGLGLLGVSGDQVVDAATYASIKAQTLCRVRGTVQADILKEEQAQNTCIFSVGFSLKVMGDIQRSFVDHAVQNFYSVSVSGYHIAEAGANPITQLAFTLANGFTYVEHYLARGMSVDDFAPNLSFFFSNGLDAEYTVLGRVARRLWAIALRDRYGASERSQKLKYHVQTSGRSLHAQEMAFNDIRTTLQALVALQDHCNSLHTNAYDEAVTTPTEESVRRAMAIQLIINREFGMGRVENALQGSYVIDELTDLVEEAVLQELERLSERGGVLGAMETLYQRSKIQEESLHYESLKHSGELPVIGVNTFENPDSAEASMRPATVMRASEGEKEAQLASLAAFHTAHASDVSGALARLQGVAREGGNVFEELMETVKHASLGQITDALFDVGGRYRRSM